MADLPPALSQAPEGPQGHSTHVWASARAGAACWLNSRLPARISQNLVGDLSTGSHNVFVPFSDKLPVEKHYVFLCKFWDFLTIWWKAPFWLVENQKKERWIFRESSSRTGRSKICSCVHHGLAWSCNMYVCMCVCVGTMSHGIWPTNTLVVALYSYIVPAGRHGGGPGGGRHGGVLP